MVEKDNGWPEAKTTQKHEKVKENRDWKRKTNREGKKLQNALLGKKPDGFQANLCVGAHADC